MCLSISNKFHKSPKGVLPAPVTLKQPVLVWKMLRDDGYGGWEAPFQHTTYLFGKRYTVKSIKSEYDWGNKRRVNAGLHAFVRTKDANGYISRGYSSRKLFPAVIPAGAQVFFGYYGHIVATELTVYKSLDDVKKVYGGITDPVNRKDTY